MDIQSKPIKYRSPKSIRSGWSRKEKYSFDQEDLISESESFFRNELQCPLSKKYMGDGHYWILEKITKMFDEPCFEVSTIDGGFTHFVVAKGMVKVNQLGVSHHFEAENYNSTQNCTECLEKVSKFFRNTVYPAMKIKCPLASEEQLKKQYQYFLKK